MKINKVLALALGLIAMSGVVKAETIQETSVTTETQKKQSFIKVNTAKLGLAATTSITKLSEIVTSIVDIAKLRENPAFAEKIRAMTPANLKKAQQDAVAAGKTKGSAIATAFKDFAHIAPQVIKPVVHIVNNVTAIVKSLGEAIINPEATIRGKKALDTFNSGITTVSAILSAAESAMLLLPGLQMPTDKQAEQAAEQIAEF